MTAPVLKKALAQHWRRLAQIVLKVGFAPVRQWWVSLKGYTPPLTLTGATKPTGARTGAMAGFAALLLALLATPAAAETWQPMHNGSSVTLRPSERPGAAHELHFNNSGSDGAERLAYGAHIGPHAMEVTLGAPEADTIRVTPAEGFIAVPEELTLPDGSSGVIVIYTLEGLGL